MLLERPNHAELIIILVVTTDTSKVAAIRAALRRTRWSPAPTRYCETHFGTFLFSAAATGAERSLLM